MAKLLALVPLLLLGACAAEPVNLHGGNFDAVLSGKNAIVKFCSGLLPVSEKYDGGGRARVERSRPVACESAWFHSTLGA